MAHDRKPSHVRGSNRAAKYFGITLQQYAALAAVVVLVAIVVAGLLPGSSAPERWAGQASRRSGDGARQTATGIAQKGAAAAKAAEAAEVTKA